MKKKRYLKVNKHFRDAAAKQICKVFPYIEI